MSSSPFFRCWHFGIAATPPHHPTRLGTPLPTAWLFALVALSACAASPGASGKGAASAHRVGAAQSAEAILEGAKARYASCRTYRDSGTLVHSTDPDNSRATADSTVVFRTFFERATGKFYFDYTKTHERYFSPSRGVIWREVEGLARTWWTAEPDTTDEQGLLDALQTQAGVSDGLSGLVPTWLVDHSSTFVSLRYRLVGEEVIRGVKAFALSASGADKAVTLWFRKSDYALVKLTNRSLVRPLSKRELSESAGKVLSAEQLERLVEISQHPFVSESTIHFEPLFDAPIEPTMFRFSPPDVSSPPPSN